MNLQATWYALAQNFTLQSLTIIAAKILCLAIAFEVLAWWSARTIEKQVAPLITADAERDAAWRVKRRTLLRHTPKIVTRTTLYAIAFILIFHIFNVPVLPLSIGIGATLLLFGAALLPTLRDLAQGYTFLAEDALAPGDAVEIDGHQGVVEKFTLRAVTLRDKENRTHLLNNRDIKDIIVYRRKVQDAKNFDDPLSKT